MASNFLMRLPSEKLGEIQAALSRMPGGLSKHEARLENIVSWRSKNDRFRECDTCCLVHKSQCLFLAFCSAFARHDSHVFSNAFVLLITMRPRRVKFVGALCPIFGFGAELAKLQELSGRSSAAGATKGPTSELDEATVATLVEELREEDEKTTSAMVFVSELIELFAQVDTKATGSVG